MTNIKIKNKMFNTKLSITFDKCFENLIVKILFEYEVKILFVQI